MALFPLITLPDLTTTAGKRMKLYREVAWDFSKNAPIWRGGEPVYCTGSEAVQVWAWNALHASRLASDVWTRDYGLGIQEGLTGKAYSADVRQSEAIRYVQDALLTNPYITAVDQVSVEMDGSCLCIGCRITTVYGEVTINACKL